MTAPRVFVVGLGNMPKVYRRTRHSIGQRIVDGIGARMGIPMDPDSAGTVSEKTVKIGEVEMSLALFKSKDAMNVCGPSIAQALRKIGIPSASMIALSDSLSHHPEVFSPRFGGSHNGHNGLRSIRASCGPDFYQFRIGIGRNDADVADYVMSNMTRNELDYWSEGEGLDKVLVEIARVARKLQE